MPRRNRPGAGRARYTLILTDTPDQRGGWVVYDSRRERPVRGILGRVRVYQGPSGADRASRRAIRLNRRAAR
jgi:hypothetical protein